MKRVIIIGCPGAGKSTLARLLCDKTGLPVYYLDMLYWNSDRTTVSKEIFLERLQSVLLEDSWIIDGNYGSTMEMRMTECDTVIFLDYPLEICIDGIRQRKGKPRPDMPWVEYGEDEEFLDFIRNFEKESKPKILSLLQKYKEKNIIILKSREDAYSFIRGF